MGETRRVEQEYNIKENTVLGIDVSHHQEQIEWRKVKEWQGHKISFVYIKATEGSTVIDHQYKYNFIQAKQNGHLVGCFHYFRTTSSPYDQFNHFIKNVNKDDQDLIPMIDFEENNRYDTKTYNTKVKDFLALVTKHYNKKPILYSTQRFYNTYLKNDYKEYQWCIGRYNNMKDEPFLLDKNRWTLWQFTEKGKIDGIEKFVDIDYMHPDFNIKNLCLKN